MLTLIIGGSGSGKSSFGEELAQKSNSKLCYLATMIPYGDEGKRRVERHLKLRKGKGFETIEEYMDIGNIDIPYGSCVLLEDLPNLVANNMFTKNPQKDINMFIVNGIVQLYNKVENMIIITGDVFSDGEKYDSLTNKYIEILADVNNAVAKKADRVYEVVCGIDMLLKEE